MADQFVIKFEDVSVREANVLAEELRSDLLDADRTLKVERRRDSEASQDFGSTLLLILGTQSVVVLAQAVRAWAARKPQVRIRVETTDGQLVSSGVESKEAAAVIKAFGDAISAKKKPLK
jgi:DNA-binding transcriptional LysR family regulator